jgi:membrane protease YdiL (CAAX protease family)
LVSVYGGVTEELLLRYGLLTGVVWLLGRFIDASESAVVWTAIVLTSVAFGVSHLPATAAVFELTPVVVARAVVLNGVAGVAFGWLYWRHGLVAAVVAHLGTDLVVKLLVSVVL